MKEIARLKMKKNISKLGDKLQKKKTKEVLQELRNAEQMNLLFEERMI